MKHIKTFESYSSIQDESINEEFLGKIVKSILALPIAAISLLVVQLMDPKRLTEQALPQLIDVYNNIDILVDTLENIHFNRNITPDEEKEILTKLNMLKKVKSKFPTLEEYKKKIGKSLGYMNFRNRKYITNAVMEYEPKKMTAEQILTYIRKMYKSVTEEDIIGDVAPKKTWGEVMQGLYNANVRFGR